MLGIHVFVFVVYLTFLKINPLEIPQECKTQIYMYKQNIAARFTDDKFHTCREFYFDHMIYKILRNTPILAG